MKQSIILAICAILALTSCEKEDPLEAIKITRTEILGTWEVTEVLKFGEPQMLPYAHVYYLFTDDPSCIGCGEYRERGTNNNGEVLSSGRWNDYEITDAGRTINMTTMGGDEFHIEKITTDLWQLTQVDIIIVIERV